MVESRAELSNIAGNAFYHGTRTSKRGRLIIFFPTDDRKIGMFVNSWLEENDGQLPLAVLEKRIEEKFHYIVGEDIRAEESVEGDRYLMEMIDVGLAYRLRKGIVSRRSS